MKTTIAKVEYPETLAQKVRKIFNDDNTLYAKALEQVRFIIFKQNLQLLFSLLFYIYLK
ncbi:unnamed protein product, partial [Rotaria magnacalcarata]